MASECHRVWYNAMQEEDGFQDYLMKSLVNLVGEIRRGNQNEEILHEMALAVQNLSVIYNPTYLQESDERAFEDLFQEEFIKPVIQMYGEKMNSILTKNARDQELCIIESVNDFFVDILETFFEPYKPTILTNLDRFFEEDRYEALSNLYFIFKDISDGVDMERLTSKFHAIVQRETNEITSKSAGTDQQVVEYLAKMYSKKFKMIETVFKGDSNFLDLLNKAVAPILNKKTDPYSPCKSPEMWGIGDLTLRSNIMTMIEDVLISNNVLENFNTTKNDFGFVFTAQVMKTQAWPIRSTDNTQIKLSGELKVALDKYESIHKHFLNNRKLIWNYLHSTAEIQINYLNKPYLLSMNTYQMAIMLLFEGNNHLGFMDIKETLAIPDETLVDQLACLVESDLLVAHPMVRKMLEDKFELEIPAFERDTADLVNRKYLEQHLNDKKLYRYL
ncbi:uncharacterized protein LOC135943740 [Cloeon dipterum]|uniref:uncharacterized protein LOC135943740 n=1 Tax=Cloeon dipterum TaxID=197152 RepID=UPI0032205A00